MTTFSVKIQSAVELALLGGRSASRSVERSSKEAEAPVNSKNQIRRAFRIAGIGLICLAAIWLLGGLTDLLPIDVAAFGGHSAIRGIGSIAVVGCLLAAIGYWDR